MLLRRLLLSAVAIFYTPRASGETVKQIEANPEAKRLYDDLLSNYNRLIRPVSNNTDILTVYLRLKMSQLLEMNLKNQVMTTNLWVEQKALSLNNSVFDHGCAVPECRFSVGHFYTSTYINRTSLRLCGPTINVLKWVDYKLRWDPEEYGGVETLYVPSEHIWLPDIVLYNNADGNYEVTLMTKATLMYTGEVIWRPPAIYKSSCEINVLYFPFDEQSCTMKFGSWTYNGFQVDLKHMDQVSGSNLVDVGIDLTEFYLSVEWDILAVPATRNEEYYPCCVEPYSDITFNLTMRRKTLFYTVNLIIPCVGITFLTVLVFYLPSDSGEKITLCSSILVSLTVFFLLLAEIIPPTSLAVPLLGKYLLFTMTIVSFSICVTVCVLNVHFRSPSTHKMSPWVKTVFLVYMPRMLMMRRPPYSPGETFDETYGESGYLNDNDFRDSLSEPYPLDSKNSPHDTYETVSSAFRDHLSQPSAAERENMLPRTMSAGVLQALEGVKFIAQHIKDSDKDNEVVEDWKYISMVLDRFFLWVFTVACAAGTCVIIFQAPSLYDQRIPIDQKMSEIPLRKNMYQIPTDHLQKIEF